MKRYRVESYAGHTWLYEGSYGTRGAALLHARRLQAMGFRTRIIQHR